MASLFQRLLDASPRSIGRRLARAAAPRPVATAPSWERIDAGPLAGRELLLDRSANGAWSDMLAGRFDPEIYQALHAYLPPADAVIWDVGAHIGFHTLGFAVTAGSSGRVVGFEPNPYNRERLTRNLQHNADLAARVVILSCALADTDGESTFAASRDIDTGASSMSFLDGTAPPVAADVSRPWDRVPVTLRRADSLVRDGTAPSPHVVKIDVEGAELLVLRGAGGILESQRPAVIVEAHSAALASEVHSYLAGFGYRLRLLADLAPSRVLLCGVIGDAAARQAS